MEAFESYAELVGDQSSKVCVAFVRGLRHLGFDDARAAVSEFEEARRLYATGGQAEVDPELELELELELYLVEARVRAEGWTVRSSRDLGEARRYVERHGYAYFRPVVSALSRLRDGEALPARMDRLTVAHVARALGADPTAPRGRPATGR